MGKRALKDPGGEPSRPPDLRIVHSEPQQDLSKVSQSAVCHETACENLAIGEGYCRLHYIKNWKRIKHKEAILKNGKFRQYIRELVMKYPEKYIEVIRHDLSSDDRLVTLIMELDMRETGEELVPEGSLEELLEEGATEDIVLDHSVTDEK